MKGLSDTNAESILPLQANLTCLFQEVRAERQHAQALQRWARQLRGQQEDTGQRRVPEAGDKAPQAVQQEVSTRGRLGSQSAPNANVVQTSTASHVELPQLGSWKESLLKRIQDNRRWGEALHQRICQAERTFVQEIQLSKLGREQRQKDAFYVYSWRLAHMPSAVSCRNNTLEGLQECLTTLQACLTTLQGLAGLSARVMQQLPAADALPAGTIALEQDYAALLAEITQLEDVLTELGPGLSPEPESVPHNAVRRLL